MKSLLKSIGLFAIVIFEMSNAGCKSSDEKVDAAQVKVEEAKEVLKEVVQDAKAEVIKIADEVEWKKFKEETDAVIKANEMRMAELRTKMKASGKKMSATYSEQVNKLEQKTKDLKDRMIKYEKSQSDWESFKREFNHDMDELGKALKDLTVDNKQ